MTEKHEELKKVLEDKLNIAAKEFEKLKKEIESCSELSNSDLNKKMYKIKTELSSKKRGIKETKAKLQADFRECKADMENRIKDLRKAAAVRKEERHNRKVLNNADRAENVAEACIESATVSIKEAEIACIQALKTRVQAEEILAEQAKASNNKITP